MSEEQQTTTKTQNNYLTPLAILVGFGLVARALYFGGNQPSVQVTESNGRSVQNAEQPTQPVASLEELAPVTDADHIKGSPDAPVKIVEYSDFECPFCKRFHDTMNQVIDEYGDSGEVAWVYRHFPLEQLHPVKARAVALASECAAEQGGDETFWQFTDRYFDVTLTNNRTDIETVIPQISNEIGLNTDALTACIDEERYAGKVEADFENAAATGGRGTPWSILVAPNGKKFPINGAQPFEAVVQLIELAKKEQ